MSYGVPGDSDYMNHIYGIVKKELKHHKLKKMAMYIYRGLVAAAIVLAVGIVW